MFLQFWGELLFSREFAMACSVVFGAVAVYYAIRCYQNERIIQACDDLIVINAEMIALHQKIITDQENMIAEMIVMNERTLNDHGVEIDRLQRALMMEGVLPWNDSSSDSYDE